MDAITYWTVLLGGWLAVVIWTERSWRLITHVLSHTPLDEHPDVIIDSAPPSLCVIVPACNEGTAIERCLRSLIAQDYPGLRIVAVDDRSTDDTGAIMDRLAGECDRLTVLHVDSLPGGWLGKNHANHLAANTPAARACGYLLFTDGDILFDPDCVRRALRHALDDRLDHLALMPHLIATGFLEKVMCHFFGVCFLLKCRVWGIEKPRKKNAFCGVGAFNLVRRTVYDGMGGHETLRLEVLDDYKLGKLMKHAGGRCRLLDSGAKIRVRWQVGLGGVIRGFEKNGFAGCDYSLAKVLLSMAILVLAFIAPPVLAVTISGAARWGWVAASVVQVATLTRIGRSFAMAVLSPLCAVAMIWAVVRATVLTYRRGGVAWRGTVYPIDRLRRGLV